MIRALALAAALVATAVAAPAAAQQPQPPAGLSQQQVDQLVDTITKAVRAELARDPGGRPAAKPAAAAPGAPAAGAGLGAGAPLGAISSSGVFDRFVAVMAAAPNVAPEVAATVVRLLGTPENRGGFLWLALRIAVIAALVALVIAGLRRIETRLRPIAYDSAGTHGRRTRIMLAVALDLAHRAIPIAFVYALLEFWLRTDEPQQRLILRTLAIVAFWYLLTFPVDAALRPRHPQLRLVRLGDAAARIAWFHLYGILLAGTATIHYLQMLIHNGTSIPSAQFLALLIAAAVGAWTVVAILAVRAAQLTEEPATRAVWPYAVGAVAGVVWLTWVIGVLNVDLAHFDALVWSIAVIATAWVVDATVGLAIGRQVDPDARVRWWRDVGVLRVLRRIVRVAAVIVIGVLVVQTWIVDMLGIVSDERWRQLKSGMTEAGLILVVGYLAWEALRIFVDRKLAYGAASTGPGKDEEEKKAGSRFQTMLPVMRIFAGIGIGVITVLFALSQLGMNIGPLIAGASIFGLAISFGSQTLVRDIVSGVFFMGDDAFRVGEYIDTGRLKGTVEGISLRSIKLRHQNGQVHTVPFGQIQSVTNFSRDWATIKFNLRLARDTDMEKVRKLAKKVGAAMLEDPELKPEFIEQLKLQGLADIEPSALVARFKFTVRPAKPSWVQRQAVKRLMAAFKDNGIEFASGAVTVQTVGGADAAAGAVAAARPAPAPAPGD